MPLFSEGCWENAWVILSVSLGKKTCKLSQLHICDGIHAFFRWGHCVLGKMREIWAQWRLGVFGIQTTSWTWLTVAVTLTSPCQRGFPYRGNTRWRNTKVDHTEEHFCKNKWFIFGYRRRKFPTAMKLKIIHIIQVSDIDIFISKYSFIRFLRVSLVPRHDAENNTKKLEAIFFTNRLRYSFQSVLGCSVWSVLITQKHADSLWSYSDLTSSSSWQSNSYEKANMMYHEQICNLLLVWFRHKEHSSCSAFKSGNQM